MLSGYGILLRAVKPPCLTALHSRLLTTQPWAERLYTTAHSNGSREGTAQATGAEVKGQIQNESPKRKRGRPRKTAPAEPSIEQDSPSYSGNTAPTRPRRRSKPTPSGLPSRLTALASDHHTSLTTFLRYARAKGLNPNSNVHRGTHYEYTCMRTLSSELFNFELHRTGRANDLGIDLLGWWKLPAERSDDGNGAEESDGKIKRKRKRHRRLKVLAQCKLTTAPRPAMLRELEGAFAGAPAGWNDSDSVLALLLTTSPATKGVIAALQRSRLPMGLLQITVDGDVKQFLWNAVAAEKPEMRDLGVVVRYVGSGKKDGIEQSVRLSWKGRVWRA